MPEQIEPSDAQVIVKEIESNPIGGTILTEHEGGGGQTTSEHINAPPAVTPVADSPEGHVPVNGA